MSDATLLTVNLLALVDQGEVGLDPYRIDRDGKPYVAVGDGGTVLGLRLGDSAFDHVGDHAAPGVCLVHPSDDARHALVGLSCLGNTVTVRSGEAAGATGVVLGKRGGGQRVIAVFSQDVLRCLRPSDQVAIASRGQGSRGPAGDARQMNVTPDALDLLGVRHVKGRVDVEVRTTLTSKVVGNGIGRPMAMWDVDLQVGSASGLRLGDLVAVEDLDARTNAGYRRGYLSVGLIVHGASPQPGHGPGLTVLLSGPAKSFSVSSESERHAGLGEDALLALAES